MVKHCTLQCLSPVLMLFQSVLTGNKYFSYNFSQTHFDCAIWVQKYANPS